LDPTPTLGVKSYLRGSLFRPGTDIKLTLLEPSGSQGSPPFGGPTLHVGADGNFGPFEITFGGSEEIGHHGLTASDGDCSASIDFDITG
jgi:hypothetical protein